MNDETLNEKALNEEVNEASTIETVEAIETAEVTKSEAEATDATEAEATEVVEALSEASPEVKEVEAVEAEAAEEAKAAKEAEEVAVTAEIEEQVEATEEAEVPVEVIPSMAEFEDEVNASMKKIYNGDIVEGHIITVTSDELLVNIGYIADGIVPASETQRANDEKLADLYKVGDKVFAEVLKKDDGEGNVLLSLKKGEQIAVWDELEAQYKDEATVTVTVSEAVKAGVVCDIKGVRAFMPASLISINYVEDLKEFVGKTLEVKIVDFDRSNTKVILSRKVIEQKENKVLQEAFYSSVKVGDRFTGTVKKLMDFGAFVNIGPVDGLIRNQDLSWTRVKHPSEVIKEGETVDVYVVNVDAAKQRIGLGLKEVKEDPLAGKSSDYKVNGVYTGTVTRVESYGAFVKISETFEGLVHVSELSDDRVNQASDVISVGDEVKVKVLDIDRKSRKVKLSVKAAKDAEERAQFAKYAKEEENATTNLKDVFSAFLKDIE